MSDRDLFDAVANKTGGDSRRHCGRQDREPASVGLRPVPVGGPGARGLPGGAGGDEVEVGGA